MKKKKKKVSKCLFLTAGRFPYKKKTWRWKCAKETRPKPWCNWLVVLETILSSVNSLFVGLRSTSFFFFLTKHACDQASPMVSLISMWGDKKGSRAGIYFVSISLDSMGCTIWDWGVTFGFLNRSSLLYNQLLFFFDWFVHRQVYLTFTDIRDQVRMYTSILFFWFYKAFYPLFTWLTYCWVWVRQRRGNVKSFLSCATLKLYLF
jgi:hypothetical protein